MCALSTNICLHWDYGTSTTCGRALDARGKCPVHDPQSPAYTVASDIADNIMKGAIGGAIGGVAIGLALYFWKKRQKKSDGA